MIKRKTRFLNPFSTVHTPGCGSKFEHAKHTMHNSTKETFLCDFLIITNCRVTLYCVTNRRVTQYSIFEDLNLLHETMHLGSAHNALFMKVLEIFKFQNF